MSRAAGGPSANRARHSADTHCTRRATTDSRHWSRRGSANASARLWRGARTILIDVAAIK